jgi:hypothetical protein
MSKALLLLYFQSHLPIHDCWMTLPDPPYSTKNCRLSLIESEQQTQTYRNSIPPYFPPYFSDQHLPTRSRHLIVHLNHLNYPKAKSIYQNQLARQDDLAEADTTYKPHLVGGSEISIASKLVPCTTYCRNSDLFPETCPCISSKAFG